jgi:hypothetical protein
MPPKLCELAAALRRVRVLEPMRLPPLLRRELVLTERVDRFHDSPDSFRPVANVCVLRTCPARSSTCQRDA